MKNYYQIIGIDTDASQETIKNAYLLKIKKYHPDLYAGDKNFALQKTSELNEAYEVLKDETKRAEYNKKINIKQNKTIKDWWKDLTRQWQDMKKMYDMSKKKKKKNSPKLTKEEQQLKNDKKKLTSLILITLIAIFVILFITFNSYFICFFYHSCFC